MAADAKEPEGAIRCLVHDQPLEDESGRYHGNCPDCADLAEGESAQ